MRRSKSVGAHYGRWPEPCIEGGTLRPRRVDRRAYVPQPNQALGLHRFQTELRANTPPSTAPSGLADASAAQVGASRRYLCRLISYKSDWPAKCPCVARARRRKNPPLQLPRSSAACTSLNRIVAAARSAGVLADVPAEALTKAEPRLTGTLWPPRAIPKSQTATAFLKMLRPGHFPRT